MSPVVETMNFILGTGGVVLLVGSAVLYVDIFFFKRTHFKDYVETYGLWAAAGILVSTVIVALIYSERFGFVPCGLCWLMRIFVFSQAVLIPIAAFRKDTGIAIYGLALSAFGIVIGLYQHYLQIGGSELIGCPSAAGDCAKRILFEYGFMSFPLLGVSMLLFVSAIYIYVLRKD